jgi:ArsR family transcriptional regulator, arsenate/arsenite/antimonite-responsive transcriptional repressor
MKSFLAIAKALSDETRVRALISLEGGELCLCQVVDLLKLSPSTLSKHMSVLRDAGLVAGRRDGRWMHYRISGSTPAARGALRWARRSLAGEKTVVDDAKRVCCIRGKDLNEVATCCYKE